VAGDGIPSATYISNAQALGNVLSIPTGAIPNGAGSLNMSPVIWHRSTNTFTLINGYVVRPKFATQRRRGDFGRVNIMPF
jgi:hypothetical protein